MSAVMSTLSLLSGGRRAHRKLAHSSGRKSGQFSDAGEERARSLADLKQQQRSASLQTLENSGVGAGVVNLENLEAKMASIEVSLAGSRRRSAGAAVGAAVGAVGRDIEALRSTLTEKDTLIQSLKKQLTASLSAARLASAAPCACGGGGGGSLSAEERHALRERAAAVRADLDARRAALHELRRRLERTHVTDNIDSRIQQAELQYQAGREELELQALGEQARALHALLEAPAPAPAPAPLYPVVRECGGAAWLVAAEPRAGSWGAVGAAGAAGGGLLVDWAREGSGLRVGDRLVEVDGISVVACRSEEELRVGGAARVLALRGSPPPCAHAQEPGAGGARGEACAWRAAAERADGATRSLRADNTRLTHRISYLEDQVGELLARHNQLQPTSSSDSCITVNKTKKNVTNISISSTGEAGGAGGGELQVFQKGPDVTALVAGLPGLRGGDALPLLRPRSNASGASSRAAASPRSSPAPPPRSHSAHALRHSLSQHCVRADCGPYSAYSAETDAAIRMIERNQRHMDKQRRPRRCPSAGADDSQGEARDAHARSAGDLRAHHYEIKKAADRIQESIKKTNWAERKTLSIIEQLKRSQRLRKIKKNDSTEDVQLESEKHYMYHRIDGKVLENAHKSSRRTSKLHSRSAKSSEMESECSDFPNGELYHSSPRIDCDSEGGARHYRRHDERARADGDGRARPTPPRKPLRLSLHKARSAHSLATGSESESRAPCEPQPHEAECGKKPVKRTHGSERRESHGSERREGRDSARATPRPTRKLLPALSAPAADALYPDTHTPRHAARNRAPKWC